MKRLEEKAQHLYPYALVGTLFLVLLIPWGYYDESIYRHTFVYKKAALFLLGLATLLSIYVHKSWKSALCPAFVGILALSLSYLLYGNLEKHFVLQFIYLEVARQIFLMPTKMKRILLRVNPVIVYAMVLKGVIWSNGNYIHGGYFSSNLFSFFLFLFCLPEIKAKRYYNLILPLYYLFVAGSKSVYLGLVMIMLYGSWLLTERLLKQKILYRVLNKINIFYSLGMALIFALFVSLSLKSGLLLPSVYKNLSQQKREITLKNLKRRGIVPVSLEELKVDYESKQEALLTENPVSPYKTTLVLRAIQYDTFFNFKNFFHVFIVGDFRYILERAYGFNPHNAVVDIFSRLGVIFCFILAFLYRKTLFKINSPLFLAATLPAICLQPYGFTLGHGFVLFSLVAFTVSEAPKED